MKEKDLEKLFSDFLIHSKGYPTTSLLHEAVIRPQSDEENFRRYTADLLILDTEFNNYLALIEFKNQNDKKSLNLAYNQVAAFLNALNNSNLPAFLVIPFADDFEIYLFSSDSWMIVDKEDFPQYQTLQSKAQTDNKSFFEILSKKKYTEAQKKKELLKGTAWSSVLSLIAGTLTVIAFSVSTIWEKKQDNKKNQTLSNDTIAVLVNSLSRKIDTLESQIKVIKSGDTLLGNYSHTAKINELETRLANFERTVTSSPNPLLQLQQINFEFKELASSLTKEKEISELKISNLKEKLDQVIIWTSGLIITIIGSIIGFAVNAFRKN